MTPVVFDITSQQFKRNPYLQLARMREAGPFVRIKLPLVGQLNAATTYEAVTSLLRNQQQFVLEPRHAGRKGMPGLFRWIPRTFRLLGKNMLTMDEPDHRRLRSLVEQAFQRQSIEGMRGRLAALADSQLEQLAHQANKNSESVDLVKHFARPFPLDVICELLGLPEKDRPMFSLFASGMTRASSALSLLAAMPGIWRLMRYLRQQFAECRRQPRPGLISALIEVGQEGNRLSEDELLAMTFLLLMAGHETTVHLISGAVLTLLQHPDQKQLLLSDWSHAETAVDEVLRYVSPVQLTKLRYAAQDTTLLGHTIRRGDVFTALLAAANCDPAEFADPQRFDIRRSPNPHVAFGTGIHVCLGLKLARVEAAIALQKLFTRFPQLALAVEEQKLSWIKRLGLRAVTALPLVLSR